MISAGGVARGRTTVGSQSILAVMMHHPNVALVAVAALGQAGGANGTAIDTVSDIASDPHGVVTRVMAGGAGVVVHILDHLPALRTVAVDTG